MRKSNFNFKVSFARFNKSADPHFLIYASYIYTDNSLTFTFLSILYLLSLSVIENHNMSPRVKVWEVF